MSNYPNRNSIKFARGGVTKPFSNVSVKYIPTKPDMPDISGLNFLEDTVNKNNALIESERARRQANQDVIKKVRSEAVGFGSALDSIFDGFDSRLKSFNEKQIENPNFVFSPEGRRTLNEIHDFIRPEKLRVIKQQFEIAKRGLEKAQDKGIADDFLVTNGQLTVLNKETGKLSNVPVSNATNIFRDPNLEIIDSQTSLFDAANRMDPTQSIPTFGGGISIKEAKDEVSDAFKNIGQDKRNILADQGIQVVDGVPLIQSISQTTRSNINQRNAALSSIYSTLSQEARDAFRGDYIKKTGDFSNEGFANYLVKFLRDRSGAVAVEDVTFDRDSKNVPEFVAKGIAGIFPDAAVGHDFIAQPGLEIVTNDRTLVGRTFFNSDLKLVTTGTSTAPVDNTPLPVRSFTTESYVFGDTGMRGIRTSKKRGKKINPNFRLKNAIHEKNLTLLRRLGNKYIQQKDGSFELDTDPLSGAVVIAGESNIPDTRMEAEIADDGYNYILDNDGNRIEVENIGVEKWTGIDKGDNVITVFEITNSQKALRKFGNSSLSGSTSSVKFADQNGLNNEGNKMLKRYAQGLVNVLENKEITPKQYNQIKDDIQTADENLRSENAKVKGRAIDFFNKLFNEMRQREFDQKSIRRTPKSDDTAKKVSEFDFR